MKSYKGFYRQVNSERDISASNFSRGKINYDFKLASSMTWNPSKSFFRVRIRVQKGDGTQLNNSDDIAPNMFLVDNLFQQQTVKINGVPVSSQDDYIAQTASLKHRMLTSDTYLEKFNDILLSSESARKRMQIITENGSDNPDSLSYKGLQLAAASSGTQLNFLDLGTNTVQFIIADNTITFADGGGVAIPDLREFLHINDVIYFNDGGEKVANITSISASSLTVSVAVLALGAAALVNQVRRAQLIINDGKRLQQNRQQDSIELIWKPSLGFFDLNEYFGGGSYKIELLPNNSSVFQKFAVESLREENDIQPGSTANDYKFEMVQMLLYIYQENKEPGKSMKKKYGFTECRLQSQNLNVGSLIDKTFIVNKYTHSLTLAFAQSGVGDDIRFSRSKFKIQNNDDLKLKRYYIRFKGLTLPNPTADLLNNSRTDFTSQYYYENLCYANSKYMADIEPLSKFQKRGAYYHYKWPAELTGNDRVQVTSEFDTSITDAKSIQMYLFDWYSQMIELTYDRGMIIRVEKLM